MNRADQRDFDSHYEYWDKIKGIPTECREGGEMIIYNRLKDGGGFVSYELEKIRGRILYRLAGADNDWETLPLEWRDDALDFLIGHMRVIIQHLREGKMSAEDILLNYCFSQQGKIVGE